MSSSLSTIQKPLLHFTPPKNWLNDPNGLVYHNGQYHLFYQYNPNDTVWGDIHWGHAVSSDCLNWENRDIAIYPNNNLKHIFSGCGVVDRDNSSGFFKESTGIVLLFTGVSVNNDANKEIEQQYIGYLDENSGKVILPENNLIIKNPGHKNFRDPKVIFISETKLWVMTLACGDHIRFFSSTNLKNWSLEDNFIPEKLTEDEIIECPNLFPLSDGTEGDLWVLSFSIINKISKKTNTCYLTGQLSNNHFIKDSNQMRPIDSGHDFYAPQFWAHSCESLEDNSRGVLWIGWMNNWSYAEDFPNKYWNGIMSVPRQLSINRNTGIPKLIQQPLAAIDSLKKKQLNPVYNKNNISVDFAKPAVYDIRIKLLSSKLEIITLKLSETKNNEFVISTNLKNKTIELNRQETSFQAMKDHDLVKKSLDIDPPKEMLDIRLIIDFWTIELFLFEGSIVISEIIKWQNFPKVLILNGENLNNTNTDFSCWELRVTSFSSNNDYKPNQILTGGYV